MYHYFRLELTDSDTFRLDTADTKKSITIQRYFLSMMILV